MAILRYRAVGASTWIDIADPQTLSWNISDLDSEAGGTGRGQDGTMRRDRVAIKRKLDLTWSPMNASQMSQLLSCMTLLFFELEYPDALTGTKMTGIFYVGDRTTPMYRCNGTNWLWEGLKANFTEQ
ncbi:MAG: DUF6711 family protein [Oscillospiraceae bacterium]